MTDPTKSIKPTLSSPRSNSVSHSNDLSLQKYCNIQIPNNIKVQAICANVPLPPQAYDSFKSNKRKRRSAKRTVKIVLEYPKPAIPSKYEYLYIGANDTLIPWQFYVKIPWYSYQLATRYLAEYIFEADILSTHNLHGKQQLDRLIVEDIVTHVGERCNVSVEYVIFIIAKICADFARLKMKGCLNADYDPYLSSITF